MICIVDTHALVWYLTDDPSLSQPGRRQLEDDNVKVVISVIVLAEVKHLFAKRRITLSLDDILDRLGEDNRCMVYPFDLSCIEALPTELDLHDGMIVATAITMRNHLNQEVVVITKDEAIRQSGLIPIIW